MPVLKIEYLSSYNRFFRVGITMNANEEMLAGYADPDASYPDADPDAT